jgi:hypothetical protein
VGSLTEGISLLESWRPQVMRHSLSSKAPSAHALRTSAPAKRDIEGLARNSADDVTVSNAVSCHTHTNTRRTQNCSFVSHPLHIRNIVRTSPLLTHTHTIVVVQMSGKVEWWAEEVALERIALAEDDRERMARRRAARLAASEEQERRVRQVEIARAMEMVERMEEGEIAKRMEEAERRRRMKEVSDAENAALLEQHAQRSSALHSFVQERDRILSSNGTAAGAPRVEPLVSLAMEREMQRRAASQMVSVNKALTDDASVSSASILQGILAKFAEQDNTYATYATANRSADDSADAGEPIIGIPSSVTHASQGVQPTPRTEFSRRVKPTGFNNFSMDVSEDSLYTSTMNSTQDSALNPLMSFGSPPSKSPPPALGMSSRDTPAGKTVTRMRGLAEEDSTLLRCQQIASPNSKSLLHVELLSLLTISNTHTHTTHTLSHTQSFPLFLCR